MIFFKVKPEMDWGDVLDKYIASDQATNRGAVLMRLLNIYMVPGTPPWL